MILTSFWMGQSALTEPGVVSVIMDICSVTLAGFSGVILTRVSEPEAIPDEEMSTLTSRLVVTMLLTGLAASAVIFSISCV